MSEHQNKSTGLSENELDVQLRSAEAIKSLNERVLHLETLESSSGWVALDKAELTVDTASVTFANISAIYASLKIILSVRTDRANVSDNLEITVNGAGTGYDYLVSTIADSAALSTSEGRNQSNIVIPIVGDSAQAQTFASWEILFPNYSSSAIRKNLLGTGGLKFTNLAGAYEVHQLFGHRRNIAIISEIGLVPATGPNFLAGSTFYLFGLRKSA